MHHFASNRQTERQMIRQMHRGSPCILQDFVPSGAVAQTGCVHLSVRPTIGIMTMKSTCRVLGHSLIRSFPRLHRKLICLLCTACCARALRCARSCARSLAHSLALELMGKSFMSMNWMRRFHTIATHCASVHMPVRNAYSQTRARRILRRVSGLDQVSLIQLICYS